MNENLIILIAWAIFATIDLTLTKSTYNLVKQRKKLTFDDIEVNIFLRFLVRYLGEKAFGLFYIVILVFILLMYFYVGFSNFLAGFIFGSYIVVFFIHGKSRSILKKRLRK